jgi:hypothetical protein
MLDSALKFKIESYFLLHQPELIGDIGSNLRDTAAKAQHRLTKH